MCKICLRCIWLSVTIRVFYWVLVMTVHSAGNGWRVGTERLGWHNLCCTCGPGYSIVPYLVWFKREMPESVRIIFYPQICHFWSNQNEITKNFGATKVLKRKKMIDILPVFNKKPCSMVKHDWKRKKNQWVFSWQRKKVDTERRSSIHTICHCTENNSNAKHAILVYYPRFINTKKMFSKCRCPAASAVLGSSRLQPYLGR